MTFCFDLYSSVFFTISFMQQRLIDIFSGNYAAYDDQVEEKEDIDSLHASIQLLANEKLQIHMDCMNAVGEVITVDDVDDLGGAVRAFISVVMCYI